MFLELYFDIYILFLLLLIIFILNNSIFLHFIVFLIICVRRWITWEDSELRLGSQAALDVIGVLMKLRATTVGVPARTDAQVSECRKCVRSS